MNGILPNAVTRDIEIDVDGKIEEYFESHPLLTQKTKYSLVVVSDNSCINFVNNARYLFTDSASEVCILADPEESDEGKEILILNDTGNSLIRSNSGAAMKKLTGASGNFNLNIPIAYKGRFRVINGELVEIG